MSISEISAVSQLPLRAMARISANAARAHAGAAEAWGRQGPVHPPADQQRDDGNGEGDPAETAPATAPVRARATRPAHPLPRDERRALADVGEHGGASARRAQSARHLSTLRGS